MNCLPENLLLYPEPAADRAADDSQTVKDACGNENHPGMLLPILSPSADIGFGQIQLTASNPCQGVKKIDENRFIIIQVINHGDGMTTIIYRDKKDPPWIQRSTRTQC